MNSHVSIYTDGSTYPTNPGQGAVGYVLVHKGTKTTIKVVGEPIEHRSTNNWAETQAVAYAFATLKKPCDITLYTDSQYVVYGLARIFSNKALLKTNRSAWENVQKYVRKHSIKVVKIEAHTADKGTHSLLNKLADKVASFSARLNRAWYSTHSSIENAYAGRPTRTTK